MLKKASFLFLDEATSALAPRRWEASKAILAQDNTSEKMIQQTIDNISASVP